jgi:hypothetical protein
MEKLFLHAALDVNACIKLEINIVFLDIIHLSILDKNRTMDKVQKHDICIHIPSSQSFRSRDRDYLYHFGLTE